MKNLHKLLLILLLSTSSCEIADLVQPILEEERKEPTSMTRTEAIEAYNQEYNTPSNYTWNGNVNNCEAGTIPQNVLDKVEQRVNFYRRLVGLLDNSFFREDVNNIAQEAALMMHANGRLSHTPSSNWSCYTQDGYDGAASGNLAFNGWNVTISENYIDQWIEDAGANNTTVGHRLHIFMEKNKQPYGFGSTGKYAALSTDWFGGEDVEEKLAYIAYPPKGHIVSDLVYPRWSFKITNVDLSTASVTVTDENGNEIDLDVLPYDSTLGALVWEPNIDVSTITADKKYVVEVSNVFVGLEKKTYTYDVIIVKR